MFKLFGGILFFIFFISVASAQNLEVVTIQIISDNETQNGDLKGFEEQIKEEITILLANRNTVVFKAEYCNCKAERLNEIILSAYNNETIDIVIAIGTMVSAVLAQQPAFPKPSIASIIIDNELQNVPITAEGTSGKDNFTFIQSPFSFEKRFKNFT